MKIALVIPNNVWFCPYVKIYEKVIKDLDVQYEIISWNRDGNDEMVGIQYNKFLDSEVGSFRKLIAYYLYAKFVKKAIVANGYDKLIIFTPQIGIFLSYFLKKKYRHNYIFDYRDLSIEQKSIFKRCFRVLLMNSASIFVSSPGFIKYLPKGFKYMISHNFDIDAAREALKKSEIIPFRACEFQVLTIGGIRDYSANVAIIKALADKDGFSVKFVGKGPASKSLETYVEEHGITNIKFKGYYEKKEEGNYIDKASILNIYYPDVISHSTALSNRFYNALVYKKPMIVTANSIQGDYVEKYNLGLSLTNCIDLTKKIRDYFIQNDCIAFNRNCNLLLESFLDDYDEFYDAVKKFIKIKY